MIDLNVATQWTLPGNKFVPILRCVDWWVRSGNEDIMELIVHGVAEVQTRVGGSAHPNHVAIIDVLDLPVEGLRQEVHGQHGVLVALRLVAESE